MRHLHRRPYLSLNFLFLCHIVASPTTHPLPRYTPHIYPHISFFFNLILPLPNSNSDLQKYIFLPSQEKKTKSQVPSYPIYVKVPLSQSSIVS